MGQVTSGKKYFSDGVPVGGCRFDYAFDSIGNRSASSKNANSSSYTANNLNQYTQRTLPGVIWATGTALSNAVVAIREGTNTAVLANRHQDYFWKTLSVDNDSALFSTTNLQVRAYTGGVVRTEIREDIIAQTPETFTYDLDGNLLTDGLWTNTWNAENRLIATESLSNVPDEFKKKLEFVYDYMGRRISKKIYSGYSSGAYTATNEKRRAGMAQRNDASSRPYFASRYGSSFRSGCQG